MKQYIQLLHEVGMLAKTPRSGFAFLGSGQQSVAEHSYRMTLIALVLADLSEKEVDREKLMQMCLIHDLPEARTGDLNYVNKRYVTVNDEAVLKDLQASYPCGEKFVNLIREYEQAQTLEAQIAHDADQIELLLFLKEELEHGNLHANDWYENVKQRLTLPQSKKMATEILNEFSKSWWYKKGDDHWINGSKKKR